jgi:hypothetical protein
MKRHSTVEFFQMHQLISTIWKLQLNLGLNATQILHALLIVVLGYEKQNFGNSFSLNFHVIAFLS